MKRQAVIKLP